MKSKQEIKQWILKNCVNEQGYIDLEGLDFSDFDGDVVISRMKVKRCLIQSEHRVGGDLCQSYHKVDGILHQHTHEVKGDLSQGYSKVGGSLYQSYHDVSGNIRQLDSKFGNELYVSKLDEYDITETSSGELKATHKPKQMTMKELEAIIGYKFEIVEE